MNLEIEEGEEITIKVVTTKFKKKALRVHSDKTHKQDDEEFKQLLHDYNVLKDAINQINGNKKDIDEAKTDLQTFFETHNFAKEFSQSWTIFIEKERVENWKQEMKNRFPEPKIMQGNGTQYKSQVDDRIVYTTLYDVECPKMNIQGNHICIRKFVLSVLPVIYKSIRDSIPVLMQEKIRKVPLNAKVKLSGETVYTCEVCPKTYVRKSNIKKHIQVKHAPIVARHQTSGVLIPLGPPTMIIPEELVEVAELIGPEPIETNWQCGECGFISNEENGLKEHIEGEHTEETLGTEKIIYLIPEGCKPCDSKDQQLKEVEAKLKEFELLQRRHVQLKEKYEDVVKANKEYSKNVFNVVKENQEMKVSAEKDAEALMDALSMNQVLIEEVKVKDAIIKAQEDELKLNTETSQIVSEERENEVSVIRESNDIKCDKCEWTSPNHNLLKGHMLKHNGQYVCPECDLRHLSRSDLDKHIQTVHKNENKGLNFSCTKCEREFPSQNSVKQHMNSMHKDDKRLPVGHHERADKNSQRMIISCTECGKRFATGNQVEEHMKEHSSNIDEQHFEKSNKDKHCRYFRNGFCRKGDECNYKHITTQRLPKRCNRGQDCSFFQQNRCRFFHPGFDIQKPRVQRTNYKQECRFKDECLNLPHCNFVHPQDFQYVQRRTRPLVWNVWKDY